MNALREMQFPAGKAVPLTRTRPIAMSQATVGEMVLSPAEQVRLVRAIADCGDRQAFAILFRHFAPRVKTFLMRAGLVANTAEELAQETMINVWRKAGTFDPARAGVATWIFTIARNLRIDHQRQLKRRAPLDEDPTDEAEPPHSGETLVMIEEEEARVRRALMQLSDEQAVVVRLSFFSEKPHSEIASELGIPIGTVKSRIRLAMARLKSLLDEAT